jgi:hypothetical protein
LALKVGPNWRIRGFGSSANGFGTRFSDLDITCYQEDTSEEGRKLLVQELQNKLVPLLHEAGNFEVEEEIYAARIPICKLRWARCLDVDVSFCNTEPFANTQMLRAYSLLHTPARSLAVLVKLWAKGEYCCGAKEGHLSSYALTLMALYFLQVDDCVQMPCLPTEIFDGKSSTSPDHKVQWACPIPLPTLLCRFFHFYASTFVWGQEVISVRVGHRLNINHECYQKLRGRYGASSSLHIEDPFLLHRNLNCVLKPEQEQMLYMKICEACSITQTGNIPPGLSVVQVMYSKRSPIDLLRASVSAGKLSKNGVAIEGSDGYTTKPTSPKEHIAAISSKSTSKKAAAVKSTSESESTREPTPRQREPTACPSPDQVPDTWLARGSWKTVHL